VLTEFPVFHPHLLIGRGAGALLKRPQTVLDSVYRSAADGKLTLVDLKTLMEARAPNYRLLNAKNLRQVITNALYFELMTKMRIARVALAYVSRSGSVTLVSVNLRRVSGARGRCDARAGRADSRGPRMGLCSSSPPAR
jgi:hypothetical protein